MSSSGLPPRFFMSKILGPTPLRSFSEGNAGIEFTVECVCTDTIVNVPGGKTASGDLNLWNSDAGALCSDGDTVYSLLSKGHWVTLLLWIFALIGVNKKARINPNFHQRLYPLHRCTTFRQSDSQLVGNGVKKSGAQTAVYRPKVDQICSKL